MLLALIALGLWLAGSRIALLALELTLVGMLGLVAWTRRGRVRWLAGLAIAGIVVAGALGAVRYPAARNAPLGPATAARRIHGADEREHVARCARVRRRCGTVL